MEGCAPGLALKNGDKDNSEMAYYFTCMTSFSFYCQQAEAAWPSG